MNVRPMRPTSSRMRENFLLTRRSYTRLEVLSCASDQAWLFQINISSKLESQGNFMIRQSDGN